VDKTQPPVITNSFATAVLDCGSSQATLALALSGTVTGTRFWVLRYPVNAAFNPTNAISFDINPILAGTTSSLIMVDKVGEYVYVVTSTLTGCKAQGTVNVVNGALTPSFTPSPETGYAPLDVNFTNNSSSTSGSGSITSIWSFGNGTSVTNTNNASQNASYSAPGSYTVMLVTKKGVCVDSIMKIIRVDIPSKMDVPNIFTPNGDGSNDVFFLKAANLNEISCVILDRWGNKVYETNSTTGNIAWDGKNFGGKECAAGVYFYIIKAKGKDDKTFESKGNVTLIR
jgi:gliding motility-associated-like protein